MAAQPGPAAGRRAGRAGHPPLTASGPRGVPAWGPGGSGGTVPPGGVGAPWSWYTSRYRGPMSSWVDSAIWWQVYPLGFTGAERTALPETDDSVRHRLRHLTGWLDYAVELGCSGLLLGPVFASETHGYDTIDHFRIDPRLGDETDFTALMNAAESRGLRILLDGVFNHVGRGFPAFQAALAGGASAAWFRRALDGSFAVFEGHEQLVALDHDSAEVVDYVVEVMSYWLDRGIAGWRLDAAYAVPA